MNIHAFVYIKTSSLGRTLSRFTIRNYYIRSTNEYEINYSDSKIITIFCNNQERIFSADNSSPLKQRRWLTMHIFANSKKFFHNISLIFIRTILLFLIFFCVFLVFCFFFLFFSCFFPFFLVFFCIFFVYFLALLFFSL